jgi:hypothetical protein
MLQRRVGVQTGRFWLAGLGEWDKDQAMYLDLERVVSGLGAIKGEDAFRHALAESFAELGFNRVTYASVDPSDLTGPADTGLPPNLVYLTNLDAGWIAHYLEQGYALIDPIVRTCTSARLPVVWNELFHANSLNSAESSFMADARDHGIKQGLTIPIHGPAGEFALISLSSDLARSEFDRSVRETKFAAQTLAYYFHDAVQAEFRDTAAVPPPVPLTDREVEILKWTVAGKTAWVFPVSDHEKG